MSLPLTRDGLAQMFAARGYRRGAEIGVERGLFSRVLLDANPSLHLTCVDAWAPYRGYREHVTPAKLESLFADACQHLAPYGARVQIVRGWSVESAKDVPDASLDFVYLDANHTLPHVIADIAAWAPKVRVGGIVAGHDYGRRSVGHVKEAVDAWVTAYGITDWHLTELDRSPSWWWEVR